MSFGSYFVQTLCPSLTVADEPQILLIDLND